MSSGFYDPTDDGYEEVLHPLERRIKKLERQVEENHDLIQQLKGAGLFLKICFVIAGPLAALVVWARHHIT